MKRVMIIPAAGPGSRLGVPHPKALAVVDGRPMIDHLLEMYAEAIDEFVLVVAGSARAEVETHCAAARQPVDVLVQPAPTGMLDALLVPLEHVRSRGAAAVWVTWCDQIAVHPGTIRQLDRIMREEPSTALALPTAVSHRPYIHFVRDRAARIVAVLHRREGDVMPETGESDIGLFGLSGAAYGELLPRFAEAARPAPVTGERNFLPFIPWLAAQARVHTFPARHPEEAIGVNTPEDRARVEHYLHTRRSEARP